ncbi:hypothetical protein I350_06656 [Cryptococcus amylolentus CBS 6273]|uniref:Uncharacterized protein n=1 Tax=Cryptococcus amylolentus CBS 6273 TaxID=1296118 RepID=A0A1E3JGR4_9TREE|nr:hypothetical protein I350_06656 [Cryptococcus amylolentus CBS 6273]
MRAVLPKSVIARLEASQTPDFRPVASISRHLRPPRTISKVPRSIEDTAGTNTGLNANRLFRRAETPAEEAAHAYLDTHPLPASPTVSDLLRRQVTYSKFIFALIARSEDAVSSLVERAMEEKVPLSTVILTRILQKSLDNPSAEARVRIVQSVMPFLPDRLDVPLLDLLLRAVIRDSSPDPAFVEGLITDCLALDGVTGKEGWPWEIWDVLITTHVPTADFNSAVKRLGEFKRVVRAHLNAPSSSSSPPELSPAQRTAIVQVYTTTMNIWRLSALKDTTARSKCSRIPESLAEDLVEFAGGEAGLDVKFLSAWLRAEKVAQNWVMAESIVEMIGEAQEGYEVGEGGREQDGIRWLDSKTWTSIFGLYTTPCVLPPTRVLARRLLTQTSKTTQVTEQDAIPNPNRPIHLPILTSEVVNAILRAIFHSLDTTHPSTPPNEIDLSLTLVILRLNILSGTPTSPPADRKSIDILSSYLYRTARNLSLPPHLFSSLGIPAMPNRRRRNGKEKTWRRFGLGAEEWDVMTEAVHAERMKMGREVEVVHLPFSMPVARLAKAHPSFQFPVPQPEAEKELSSTITVNAEQLRTLGSGERGASFQRVLPALIGILERLIVARERQARSARVEFLFAEVPRGDEKQMEERELPMERARLERERERLAEQEGLGDTDEQILGSVMDVVNKEVLWPSRRERRVMKREIKRRKL